MIRLVVAWFDAALCSVMPGLARWTVVLVTRHDNQERQVPSVRFRWRCSAMRWITEHTQQWDRHGVVVHFEPRPLDPGR